MYITYIYIYIYIYIYCIYLSICIIIKYHNTITKKINNDHMILIEE